MNESSDSIELREEYSDHWLRDLESEYQYLTGLSLPEDLPPEMLETVKLVREARRERIEMQMLNALLPALKKTREEIVVQLMNREEVKEFLAQFKLNARITTNNILPSTDIPVAAPSSEVKNMEPTLIETSLPPFHMIYEKNGSLVRVAFHPSVLAEYDILFGLVRQGAKTTTWIRLSNLSRDIEPSTIIKRAEGDYDGMLRGSNEPEAVPISFRRVTDKSPTNYLRMLVGLSQDPHAEQALLFVNVPRNERSRIKIAPKGGAEGIPI